MMFFVFRITNACDKRCATCCCYRDNSVLSPDLFREKLVRIAEYCETRREQPLFFLTGGEPFLYKASDGEGRRYSVVDIAAMVKRHVTGAGIVVKTSGWAEHGCLDRRFNDLAMLLGGRGGEVRLGFNLFQQQKGSSKDRLSHMIDLMLRYQDVVRIEAIYDRQNIGPTFKVIEDALLNFDVPRGASLFPPVPEIPYRHVIPVRQTGRLPCSESATDSAIVLDTMPAYAGLGRATSERYYEAKYLGVCSRMQSGTDHVSYDPDLSVRHCNDAFADHSVASFPATQFKSVDEEFDFLRLRFAKLSQHLAAEAVAFGSRREQCSYCTHFVHA